MKARKLRELLNNTGYIIGDHGKYIAVGSPLCHDLIKVEKATLELTYALDFNKVGRPAVVGRGSNDGELERIWDKFAELIENGEIKDIIDGHDEIENPLPVYFAKDYKLCESHTDEYGWPNTTFDGQVMYDNVHFKTPVEAIEYGIKEAESIIRYVEPAIEEQQKELEKRKEYLAEAKAGLVYLTNLKTEHEK